MATKIKQITFGKNETFLGFVTSDQPRDSNHVINEKNKTRSDLPRHADFERAMDKLKPHLLIATGLQTPYDYNGNYLKSIHFNDFFADSDDEKERFGGLNMLGIIIHGKHAADGVQLFGTKTTDWGHVINITTGVIPLKRVPGDAWNYSMLEILDNQIDVLLSEAELFKQRKKHGAGMQQEIELPAQKPNAKPEPELVGSSSGPVAKFAKTNNNLSVAQ